jgi:branched-chain amino acid transport system substrate-binding protein
MSRSLKILAVSAALMTALSACGGSSSGGTTGGGSGKTLVIGVDLPLQGASRTRPSRPSTR